MIVKTDSGYKVKVYDNGWVTMAELVCGEWKDCVFETEADAQKAYDEYIKLWGKE